MRVEIALPAHNEEHALEVNVRRLVDFIPTPDSLRNLRKTPEGWGWTARPRNLLSDTTSLWVAGLLTEPEVFSLAGQSGRLLRTGPVPPHPAFSVERS